MVMASTLVDWQTDCHIASARLYTGLEIRAVMASVNFIWRNEHPHSAIKSGDLHWRREGRFHLVHHCMGTDNCWHRGGMPIMSQW
jgi:hypothetical protein